MDLPYLGSGVFDSVWFASWAKLKQGSILFIMESQKDGQNVYTSYSIDHKQQDNMRSVSSLSKNLSSVM